MFKVKKSFQSNLIPCNSLKNKLSHFYHRSNWTQSISAIGFFVVKIIQLALESWKEFCLIINSPFGSIFIVIFPSLSLSSLCFFFALSALLIVHADCHSGDRRTLANGHNQIYRDDGNSLTTGWLLSRILLHLLQFYVNYHLECMMAGIIIVCSVNMGCKVNYYAICHHCKKLLK